MEEKKNCATRSVKKYKRGNPHWSNTRIKKERGTNSAREGRGREVPHDEKRMRRKKGEGIRMKKKKALISTLCPNALGVTG